MRHYRWCGLTLASDVEFPELPAGRAPDATWRIHRGDGSAPLRPGRRWFHRWRFPDGRRWVAFARDPAGYILRFPSLADFDVRPLEQRVDAYPRPGTASNTFRHLILDQVLPLIVGTPNSLALHGSVVATPAGAAAFLGYSGIGKSTLAAKLGQRGCTVLSDDCCLIVKSGSGFVAVPSYPGVRLNPDSLDHAFGSTTMGAPVSDYSSKRRIGDEAFVDRPVPLTRLYEIPGRERLARATAISITPATKRDAMYALIDYTFHLDIGYAPRIKETFVLAGDIVDALGVYRLEFPWDLGASDAVTEAVLKDLL